ncbi:MAG TPA: helical backbone metal receptor [Chitinophagaceae bacterium]|nr:helical backbone metal receptor [Chitinophagaceae bacterium]
MALFTDGLGHTVSLTKVPQRIISIVPSQTELLHDLGLENKVIGITKFCVHPPQWFHTKTRVGGTKTLNLEKIKSLRPDLIIANKEENAKEQIEELKKEFPVWISDVNNYGDALQMIEDIGNLTGRENEAQFLKNKIENNFQSLDGKSNLNLRTSYLIWKEPYMVAGGDTFINDMLNKAGLQNIFSYLPRYPQINIEQLLTDKCSLLLLSSEPYPFSQKHIDELQAFLPDVKMVLVNGEAFSWYGSRMLQAPSYFKKLQKQIMAL